MFRKRPLIRIPMTNIDQVRYFRPDTINLSELAWVWTGDPTDMERALYHCASQPSIEFGKVINIYLVGLINKLNWVDIQFQKYIIFPSNAVTMIIWKRRISSDVFRVWVGQLKEYLRIKIRFPHVRKLRAISFSVKFDRGQAS